MMTISTQVTQMQPAFVNGQMLLGSVTVVVNFQEPQNYFGGQVVLTNVDDNISFTTTQDELRALAIAKAKAMIAASQLPVQQVPSPETPDVSTSEASSETKVPASN